MKETLFARLKSLNVSRIDYVVANHAEQDHSGTTPDVLAAFPMAKAVTSDKGKSLLMDLLAIPEDRIVVIRDGETLDLGLDPFNSFTSPGCTGPRQCLHGCLKQKPCSPATCSVLIWPPQTCSLPTRPPYFLPRSGTTLRS